MLISAKIIDPVLDFSTGFQYDPYMVTQEKINQFLHDLLDPRSMQDYGINGIQVGTDREIKTIGFGVDASLKIIEEAVTHKADLLITHHGFFWGKPLPVVMNFKKRLKLMLDHDIGLISYHLPLDAHAEYGNNIRILKTLKAEHCIPFGYYKGFPIGYQGELKKPEPIESITRALGVNDFHYINGGKKEIKTIAVVSGGGTSCFEEAVQKKADLFITGDRSHEIYHSALENGINVLFAGHYFTETFGVESLIPILEKEFKVHTIFFDIPTNL